MSSTPSLDHLPPFKRFLARLFGRGLEGLGAVHPESWEAGHAAALASLLEPDPWESTCPEPASQAATVTQPHLPIDAALRERMRADVARLLPAHAQPSEAQWQLIFSDTPNTCVVAGAGAGKSTSLVLRIVLLVHYLNVPLDGFTVVTFTRESRRDFIHRLTEILALWGIALPARQARERVRTFHACILPWIRSLPGFDEVRAFETLGSPDDSAGGFELRLNAEQREQLNRCYQALCRSDATFAAQVHALKRRAWQLAALEPNHPDVQKRLPALELSARRDAELCGLIEEQWRHAGCWPIEGIEPRRDVVQINGQPFQVHGYSNELKAWVVLGFDPGGDRSFKREGAPLPVWAEWLVKRTLFQAFCDKPLIWLDNYAQSKRLSAAAVAGPGFEYRAGGERVGTPLLDAFVQAASFIENLDLDVADACRHLTFAEDDSDGLFYAALQRFWPAFEAHLADQSPPILSYNRMFATFSERQHGHLANLDAALLEPLRHLMIDEFQDISPQIVAWLRGALQELDRRGGAPASLVCVGDDWQSIYGWRGSSPQYFMDFAHWFPASTITEVMLSENYRSHQAIIDAAEHIVRSAPAIPGKQARAAGAMAGAPGVPVKVLDRDDAVLAATLREHYERGDQILVLFRKGSDKSLIEKHIEDLISAQRALPAAQRQLRLLTYHSAKGLQADAVFLVGDCLHQGGASARNQLYRLAQLGDGDQPYDQAQHEESLRLAYVAITRAKRHCYWYLDPATPAQARMPRASAQIGGAAFEDLRSA